MESNNNAEAGYKAGLQAAELSARVVRYGDQDIPLVLAQNDQRLLTMTDAIRLNDERAPAPRRMMGTSRHDELDSFIAHVLRHMDEHSVIFAGGDSMMAVYNYNQPDAPRWSDHRAVYSCPRDESWEKWDSCAGRDLAQDAFAQFLEQRFDDILEPELLKEPLSKLGMKYAKPLELVTAIRDLKYHSRAKFESKVERQTGQRHLVISEGPENGERTVVPEAFVISVPVFKGGACFAHEIRVSFRIQEKVPVFRFAMHRAAEIADEAFRAMRETVANKTGLPVFSGAPE